MSDEKRPAPRFGEYADTVAPEQSSPAQSSPAAQPAPPSSTPNTAPSAAAPQQSSTPLPGVPHNLGVANTVQPNLPQPTQAQPEATEAQPAQASSAALNTQTNQGEPYRAAPPPEVAAAVQQPMQQSAEHDQQGQVPAMVPPTLPPVAPTATSKPRGQADRIITMLLLGFGALGALISAMALYQMPATLLQAGVLLGAESVTIDPAVRTLGIVGALVILTLYALTLIFSIQRVRAGKLTFWVPLSAGVLAAIITMIVTFIALTTTPELLTVAQEPGSLEQLLGQPA